MKPSDGQLNLLASLETGQSPWAWSCLALTKPTSECAGQTHLPPQRQSLSGLGLLQTVYSLFLHLKCERRAFPMVVVKIVIEHWLSLCKGEA